MFRIMNKPEVPAAVWHDPAVWHVTSVAKDTILAVGGTRDRLNIKSVGVPLSTGNIYIWCGDMGKPQAASDRSETLSYDANMNMAAFSVKFDGSANNQIFLQY